jgi:hypothetical protein
MPRCPLPMQPRDSLEGNEHASASPNEPSSDRHNRDLAAWPPFSDVRGHCGVSVATPQPSAVSSTICARQTCFCGRPSTRGRVLRSVTMALRARRSVSVRSIVVLCASARLARTSIRENPESDANVRFYPLASDTMIQASPYPPCYPGQLAAYPRLNRGPSARIR